jgi:tripartite-type tricarboxylate transporter receptor subunit TctC
MPFQITRAGALRLVAGFAALVAFGPAAPSYAAGYPDHPITLVVAFTPGGPSDVLARIVGKKMSELLDVPVVIENKPGAGGNIAGEYTAHAKADGYTLLMGNNSILATNESLYKKLNYKPETDFAPITLIGTQANILVVNPKVPAHSLKELIALCKAQPGKINFASSGYGAAAHLAGELFKTDAKVDIVHVPYKGAAPAMQALLAGDTQLMFDNLASAMSQVKAGKLRALAVTTAQRSKLAPDLPTMAEAGLRGFDISTWFGLLAPAGTPPGIVDKWNADVTKILSAPEMRERLASQGAEAAPDTPAEFARFIDSELVKYARIVKASGAKVD